MPFEFDALRAEAWRILANDQLIEPVLLERFLALLGSRLEASRALLLVLDKDQFTCAQEWMAAAGKDRDEPLPARGGKMPVAATGPLLSAGDGRGFPAGILDTAADGVLAGATIVAALHVDSRAEGTFVLVRERAWPPSAAAFLSEAVRMLAHAVGRRRAETAMRQSELRYRIVSELCADFSCSWAVDAKGRFSFEWSTGARNGLASGFAVHSLTSTEAWLALFDAEGKAKLKDLVRRSLRNEPTVAELRTVAADGEEYWLQVHSRPVYDAVAERVVRVFTLMRDVTERVHAEQALRHERDLVRAILEASPDGICVSSLDDVIIECNAAAWRFMGLSSKKDMIGRKAFEFVENIDVAVATNFRDKVLASGAARGIRGRARTPAGELIPMEHSLGLVRDPSGQPFGFVTVFNDIRERLELDAQVQQAQKTRSLEVLAGSVVQDFSDLLSTVLGNAELALSTLPADSPARQDLERVVAAGERAGDLTRQLQSFAGRGSFLLEQVNLSELIARSERRLRGAVPQRCALRFDLAAALSAVQADPRQLLQVVLNLLTNAAEAIGARPGSIDLRTLAVHCDRDLLSKAAVGTEQPEGAYVALEVRDDGRGMAQHVLEQIFDPFFTTKSSGRGLGLPAVQGIVRAHHGVVMVETEPCHGSRFRVLLPAISRPATEVRGPSVASSATPCRVLVADDEELVCRTTQAILERAGYTVVVAPDGQKALEALRARGSEFALVLLALRKPGFGTREVLAKLRRLYPELPVLLSSGLPEADPARADLQTSFVAKPFTRAELLEAVQRAAGSPSSESSLTNPKGVV